MSFENASIKLPFPASPSEYHAPQTAKRGTPEFVMSSHALREFASCPSRWIAGYENPESKAKIWGSLLDCLLTTPELFENQYAVEPEEYENDDGETKKWNNNANVCKRWKQEQLAAGKEIVDADLVRECKTAIARLLADEKLKTFVEESDKQVWVTGEWHDNGTGLVIPCKALIDFRPRNDSEFSTCLGDLKSSRNAAIVPWQKWCYSAGYFIQAAFYIDMYVAATGEDRNTWVFLLSENYPPFEPGKRMLSQDFLELGRATYRRMMENYCQCVKSGKWPGYDDSDESIQGWSLVHPEPFMQERAMFSPRFNFSETEEEPPEPTEETDEFEEVVP